MFLILHEKEVSNLTEHQPVAARQLNSIFSLLLRKGIHFLSFCLSFFFPLSPSTVFPPFNSSLTSLC